ncbi:MAG: rRNA maturation RNase YbeY [Deltaproteobacteria bacterium]|nr:rRNA maturation RNase YbeY [Deltaproteobacteria bacterium]
MSLALFNRQRKVPFDTDSVRGRMEKLMDDAGVSQREVSVVLLSDRAIHLMNRKWRAVDAPTDCLSFPASEGEDARFAGPLLGDIAISLETAIRQARGSLQDEVVFLFVHSLLHLMGYDHGTDAESDAMKKKSKELLG